MLEINIYTYPKFFFLRISSGIGPHLQWIAETYLRVPAGIIGPGGYVNTIYKELYALDAGLAADLLRYIIT